MRGIVRNGNVITIYVGGVAVGSAMVSASRAYGGELTHLDGEPNYAE